ncbi:MAG: cytochrome C [Verrucomicrobiales bacterium]|nr:cytochrome C [Verrucomicrobiales bacterium]
MKAFLTLLPVLAIGAAEPKPDPKELPRIPHTPAKDALKSFIVKEGFDLQLAAAEPLVADPVAMCFDEFGRLFVVEMIGYSERQHEKLGRIRRLVDTNGDGRFDQSTVYAKGLAWPTALFCWRGGLIVGITPDLLYFKDTNNNGVADTQKKLFTGFGRERLNVQGIFNSLRWGLDNRIHGATAHNGGEISSRNNKGKPLNLRGRDFSFNPHTLDLRAESSTAQHGMSFDDHGRKFVCSNSSHIQAILYPSRYLGLNPHFALPSQRVGIAADGPAAPVHRISPDEPWRIVRTRWRIAGKVRGPVEGGGRVSGYFTAATGITIYRGDALGNAFRGNAFIADAGSNLIHRKLLHYDNVQPVAKRPPDELKQEFIASRDNWFRPVQFANAPDGCLYIADMYRETIEHPWSIPQSIKKHLDLNSGNDRGRIWRIAPKDFNPPRRKLPGDMNLADLAATLEHPNGWHRDTAARLIYERQDKSIAPVLAKLAAQSKSSAGRIHALWALHGLSALQPSHLLPSLQNGQPPVRVQAMRLAEQFTKHPGIISAILEQVDHESSAVRFQCALTASMLPASEKKNLATAILLAKSGDDRWLQAAALHALDTGLDDLFIAMHAQPKFPGNLKLELLRLIDRRNRPAEIARITLLLARRAPDAETLAWINALGKAAPPLPALEKEALRWLTLPANEKPDATLIPAIPLATRRGFREAAPALVTMANTRNSIAVKIAAVQALAGFSDDQAAQHLLSLWPRASSRLRAEILAAMTSRPSRVDALLDEVEKGGFKKADLPASTLAGLRNQKDQRLKARAIKLLGAPPTSRTRQEVVHGFLPALKLKGNAERGGTIFTQRCATCHRAGRAGYALGPDLETLKTTGPEKILANLIDPNREVLASYVAYNITTQDDEEIVGLLGDETTTHVRVKLPLGKERLLPRNEVRAMRSQGRSIMPEGLEAGLTHQHMADLLAFITSLK